jgi:hypothetical protein
MHRNVGRKLPIQEVVDDRDGLLVLDLLDPMFSSELKDILDPSDSGD